MGDTSVGLFNFRGDQYPTNGEVFRYMSSRRGKNNQPMIIREMVSKIHGIWCLGDGFPLDRYHKLMKERKVYLAPLYALTHPRKQSDPDLSDFTKKAPITKHWERKIRDKPNLSIVPPTLKMSLMSSPLRFQQVKWNPRAATQMSTHQKGLERVRDM